MNIPDKLCSKMKNIIRSCGKSHHSFSKTKISSVKNLFTFNTMSPRGCCTERIINFTLNFLDGQIRFKLIIKRLEQQSFRSAKSNW